MYTYLDVFFIDNMDMIKISHVMTIYTNKYIFCVLCITSFYTYTTKTFKIEWNRYVYEICIAS